MKENELYVYFNRDGQILSRTPFCTNGAVRQGSTFILNFLFDKGHLQPGDTVSVMFKWPGQNDSNTFPYVSFYEDYNLLNSCNLTDKYEGYEDTSCSCDTSHLLECAFIHYSPEFKLSDEIEVPLKFGISKNTTYDCWRLYSSKAVSDGQPNLTELDGNLEITLTITRTGELNVLGTSRVFIEKDPTYKNNFQVSTYDLNRFLGDIVEQLPKNFVRDIYTDEEDYSVGYESLIVDYVQDSAIQTPKKIDLPVPNVDKNITTTDKVPYGGEQSVSLSGNGKKDNPLHFSFDMYKAKDGFGVVGFEIDDNGDLILFDERGDNRVSDYYIDEKTGELMIKYLE